MQLQYETSQVPCLCGMKSKVTNTQVRTEYKVVIFTENRKKRSHSRRHVGNENKLRNGLAEMTYEKHVFFSVVLHNFGKPSPAWETNKKRRCLFPFPRVRWGERKRGDEYLWTYLEIFPKPSILLRHVLNKNRF